MPVSFPPSPTVGQTYTYGGVTWQWNGTAWVNANTGVNFVPFSGGTMTGPLSLQGVTDGSNAAAGQVGEYLSATNAGAVTIPNGAWTTIVSLTLTAGDWDIWGQASPGSATGGMSAIYAGITTTSGGAPANLQVASITAAAGTSFAGAGLSPPILRASISATTTFYLNTYTIWSTATSATAGAGNNFIAARRVR